MEWNCTLIYQIDQVTSTTRWKKQLSLPLACPKISIIRDTEKNVFKRMTTYSSFDYWVSSYYILITSIVILFFSDTVISGNKWKRFKKLFAPTSLVVVAQKTDLPTFFGELCRPSPPLPQLLRPVRLCLWCNYTVFNFFTERIGCTVARLSSSDVLCFRRRSQRGNPENI